jgi:hypothetical protein
LARSIIHDGLAEVIAAAESGDRKFFITLESRAKDDVWVQLRYDWINAAYPYEMEPLELLRNRGVSLPDLVTLEAWEANQFATFDHPAYPMEPIVAFVEAYFTQVLQLVPSSFTLKVKR